MTDDNAPQQEKKKQEGERPYTPPSIIYSGQLTTRAGSPLGGDGGPDSIDPADLFGE